MAGSDYYADCCWCSLLKFVRYLVPGAHGLLLLHDSTGAFCVWLNALSNDFRTELTEAFYILVTYSPFKFNPCNCFSFAHGRCISSAVSLATKLVYGPLGRIGTSRDQEGQTQGTSDQTPCPRLKCPISSITIYFL